MDGFEFRDGYPLRVNSALSFYRLPEGVRFQHRTTPNRSDLKWTVSSFEIGYPLRVNSALSFYRLPEGVRFQHRTTPNRSDLKWTGSNFERASPFGRRLPSASTV